MPWWINTPSTKYDKRIWRNDNAKQEVINVLQYLSAEDENAKKIIMMVVESCGMKNMREYINKKNKYLEKNRTLTDKQFNDLFWSSSKNWKIEIRQRSLAMCKMYTALEILKKMNFFNETMKTNLKETSEWWEVKIPFFNKDWIRIQVWKDEIDKRFSWEIEWNNYSFCINSKSRFKWFKILEIAFLKRMQGEPWPNWENHKHDLQTTWNCKLDPESILYHTRDYFSKTFKILFKNLSITSPCNDECKDFAFKYFNRWVYWIDLSVAEDAMDDMVVRKNKEEISLRWASVEWNIIKWWKKINRMLLPYEQQFMHEWKSMIRFFDKHSYSIERCYISDSWEKRCRLVNPWHTNIKFDISFEDCKKIFKFNLVWFDYKNMFTHT